MKSLAHRHIQAVVCNHCGSVFQVATLIPENPDEQLLCPFCGFNPNIPCIEKGDWHEKDYELPGSKGTH